MGLLGALADKVTEIKDHHKDLGAHPKAFGAARNIAFEGDKATAASACSVIAEAYLESAQGQELLARDNGAAARALLGVILIDSANLDPAAKKVCPRDSAAAAAMMRIAPSPGQPELFQMLDAAKFDGGFWDSLTIQQCCRYDYKEFTTAGKKYGLSSCLCSLDVLASKRGWAEEVTKRAGELDLFGVLTQVKPAGGGPAARQLMLYASDASLTQRAATFAQAYNSPSLQLEPIPVAGPGGLQAFAQKNVGASRKQVQPCIGSFFTAGGSAPPQNGSAQTFGQWIATIRKTGASDAANVTLVAGNEASDADSIVTAQVYGYLKHHMAADGDGPVVPVVACNREDVTLRKETTLLLERCGVDYNHLVFLDDPGTDKLLARVSRVVLVDHNKAMGPLDALSDKVVEIRDHHKDLSAHPNATGALRDIAFEGDSATAASACSVITEAYLAAERGRELLARDNGAAARALLGVILIDSANLDPAAKKVCPRDTAAAAELMKHAPSPAQADLFAMLDRAKFDAGFWDGLSLQQCFRYDYKEFRSSGKKYGLASCLCALEVLAGKPGWSEEIKKHAAGLDMFGVLTQVHPEGGAAT